jgi:hypothetical protein
VNETAGRLTGASLSLLLLKDIDQLDRREEADTLLMVLYRLDAERRGNMSFAGARRDSDILPSIKAGTRRSTTRIIPGAVIESVSGGTMGFVA